MILATIFDVQRLAKTSFGLIQASGSDSNKKFDTAATIGGLTQIAKNYDWFWMDVAEHTDIGPTKLNVADALNPDSTLQLWQFDTQISLNLKTTPELLVKPIMKKIATACRKMHGNRLKDFAKLNPIDSVKGVLWGAVPGIGSYNQFGEDGFLSLIRHCNGDEVLIPEGQSVITKKYKACELYLDWSAAFVFPNLPPIRLHTFFKAAKSGPYKYQAPTRNIGFLKVLQSGEAGAQKGGVVICHQGVVFTQKMTNGVKMRHRKG